MVRKNAKEMYSTHNEGKIFVAGRYIKTLRIVDTFSKELTKMVIVE